MIQNTQFIQVLNLFLTNLDAVVYLINQSELKVYLNGSCTQSFPNFSSQDWRNFEQTNRNSLLLQNRTQWSWFDCSTITKSTGFSPQISVFVNFNNVPYILAAIK